MEDILQTGVQFLADQMLSNAAKPVEYLTEENVPVPLMATVGRTLFSVEENGVTKSVWTDRDFIFDSSQLDKAGIREPKNGDRIRELVKLGNGTVERIYLVGAPGGEQPYRNGDGRNVMTRVHTKLFEENPIE